MVVELKSFNDLPLIKQRIKGRKLKVNLRAMDAHNVEGKANFTTEIMGSNISIKL